MVPPPNFPHNKGEVCMFKKALHGLKQAHELGLRSSSL